MSWTDIPGWYDWQDIYQRAVADAPRDRPSIMVEVGVAFGRSLAHLARLAIDSGKPITVYGVDPWVDDWNPDWSRDETRRPTWGAEHAEWARAQGGPFSAFIKMMQTHAPAELEFVKVVRARGVDLAAMLRANVDLPHLVWIDGDHRYEGVVADLRSWAWRTGVDEMVFRPRWFGGHDYTPDFPGVQRAVREAFGDLPAIGASWLLAPSYEAAK